MFIRKISNIDNLALIFISFLPIGLLIGTGVSELLLILLATLFIIRSLSKKNSQWYKNFYFLILTILWIILILNLSIMIFVMKLI